MNLILFCPDDKPGMDAVALAVVHHYAMTEGRPYNPECHCGACEHNGRERAEAMIAVAGGWEALTDRLFDYLNTRSMRPIRRGDWEAAERVVGIWLNAYQVALMEAAPVAGNA